MNNFVVVAGTVARINKTSVNGRDLVNLTIKVDDTVNGKTVSAYLPVQVTLPNMVERVNKMQEGSHILIEGRFESYTSTNKNGENRTNYNITQLTTLQAIDEGNINHIVLWGRVSNEPRYNVTTSGNKVAGLSIANSRSYPVKAPDGSVSEWKEVTSFLNITGWGDVADVMKNFAKGTTVWATGRLATRSYDNKEGQKVYITEIIADSVVSGGTGKHNVVDGATSSTNGTTTPPPAPTTPPPQMPTSMPSSPDNGFVPLDDFTDEDELPF